MKNSYTFDKFVIGLVAVKIGQLGGNSDTFMSIFSGDTFGFVVAI